MGDIPIKDVVAFMIIAIHLGRELWGFLLELNKLIWWLVVSETGKLKLNVLVWNYEAPYKGYWTYLSAKHSEIRQFVFVFHQAARREMERQRQLEMEKQRRQEMEARRIKEQGDVAHLKAKSKTLMCEMETLVSVINGSHYQILLSDRRHLMKSMISSS